MFVDTESKCYITDPAYEGILENLGLNSALLGTNGQQLLKTHRWPLSANMYQLNMAKL